MIDLEHIRKYKENNRIEAKRALGGLPKSIWETYSSFANTLGGILLMGVEEDTDKSLHPIDLPDPQRLVDEFWGIVNDPERVSVNILSERHVTIEEIDGKHIIAVVVPRAQRYEKPVYLDGNVYNTYRRTGEGDYKCSKEEVASMLRDAEMKTQDMQVLENIDLNALDMNTVREYRRRMEEIRPGHVWEESDHVEFLYHLGALGGKDGKLHPTGAGLLMFGKEKEIIKEYPYYFLDYQEQMEHDTHFTYRIISSSGDWSGNVYDFYRKVYERISQGIRLPEKLSRGGGNTPVHEALKEALLNCLVNADYYGRQGLVIVKKKGSITLSNPGGFRIDVEKAKSGGISDSRNGALVKMFNQIDIGESLGSGIPNIYRVWREQGWEMPVIREYFKPERITLSLKVEKKTDKKINKKIGVMADKKRMNVYQRDIVIAYLTDHILVDAKEISQVLNISVKQAKRLLNTLIRKDVVVTEVHYGDMLYKLKS